METRQRSNSAPKVIRTRSSTKAVSASQGHHKLEQDGKAGKLELRRGKQGQGVNGDQRRQSQGKNREMAEKVREKREQDRKADAEQLKRDLIKFKEEMKAREKLKAEKEKEENLRPRNLRQNPKKTEPYQHTYQVQHIKHKC